MGTAALRCQVVFQLFYLLPILLQLHLKLLYKAAEITEDKNDTNVYFTLIHEM